MANEIILSADKTRQLLHISKRKCAWMLKNGIIPCKISGKKTRCYEVRLSDHSIAVDQQRQASLCHCARRHSDITGMVDRLYVRIRVENSQKERKAPPDAEQISTGAVAEKPPKNTSPHGKTWGEFLACPLGHAGLTIKRTL